MEQLDCVCICRSLRAHLEADFVTLSPQATAKTGQFAWFCYSFKATGKQMILEHLMPDPHLSAGSPGHGRNCCFMIATTPPACTRLVLVASFVSASGAFRSVPVSANCAVGVLIDDGAIVDDAACSWLNADSELLSGTEP